MKTYFRLFILLTVILLSFLLGSCKFFEEPQGKAELLSIYTTDEKYKYDSNDYYIRYLNATLKISNTGSIDIYNSTVSLFCETNEREYYKTVSFDITIKPDTCIYIPVEFDFNTRFNNKPNEKWKLDSLKIINAYWK